MTPVTAMTSMTPNSGDTSASSDTSDTYLGRYGLGCTVGMLIPNVMGLRGRWVRMRPDEEKHQKKGG